MMVHQPAIPPEDVGAEYSLETGVVDFFDGVPEAGSGQRRFSP